MRKALEPLCVDLQHRVAHPSSAAPSAVWHLSTPITGRLRESSTTALDLAIALHPTPAVGGVPAATAADAHQRTRGRPRLLRGRGRLVRRRRRRPLGGVHPLRRSCPPTAAPPTRGRAAASSPSPTPMTKSPRPPRSSEPSCLRWECEHMTVTHPPRPARRRGRADRDGARTGGVRARRRRVHRHRISAAHSAFRRSRRRCTRTSPRSTARPAAWRCGSATSPRGTAWRASTWRTCSCGRSSAATAWPARCWRRWPGSASTAATRGCRGPCWTGTSTRSPCTTPSAAAAERVDHLPGVGPRAVRTRRILSGHATATAAPTG